MSNLIKREDAVKTVIRKCSPICAWQVGTQQYPDCVVAEINALPSADAEWIPLSHDDDGMGTDFPYECDGEWVIVTDGNTISVERIKKDAYDHFYPNGRWFELDDVIAWMPLPTPYKESEAQE